MQLFYQRFGRIFLNLFKVNHEKTTLIPFYNYTACQSSCVPALHISFIMVLFFFTSDVLCYSPSRKCTLKRCGHSISVGIFLKKPASFPGHTWYQWNLRKICVVWDKEVLKVYLCPLWSILLQFAGASLIPDIVWNMGTQGYYVTGVICMPTSLQSPFYGLYLKCCISLFIT